MQLQQQHQSLSITTFFKRNTVKMSRHADKTLEIFLSKYANNFGFACQRSMRNGEKAQFALKHTHTHMHTSKGKGKGIQQKGSVLIVHITANSFEKN